MSSEASDQTSKTAHQNPPAWQPPRGPRGAAGGGSPHVATTIAEGRRNTPPRSVKGYYADWRIALVFITQILFYGLPWLQWNGRQAVLFDLAARKFYIFGMVLWPQDVIYLAVLLVISAFSLFLFTAILEIGRA